MHRSMAESEIIDNKTILNEKPLSLLEKIRLSFLKNYFVSLLIVLALMVLAIALNSIYYSTFLALANLCLLVILLMRLPAYSKYIYKIEASEGNLTLIFKSGLFNARTQSAHLEMNNFKVKCIDSNKYFPVIIIEQKKPYKLVIRQYCFGIWRDQRNQEIFRHYTDDFHR